MTGLEQIVSESERSTKELDGGISELYLSISELYRNTENTVTAIKARVRTANDAISALKALLFAMLLQVDEDRPAKKISQ